MILNIYGPSGSGKTTLVHNLLAYGKTDNFFKQFTGDKSKKDLNQKISISLIPLPLFRGTVEEFFKIFCINIKSLNNLDNDLRNLSESVFKDINYYKNLNEISLRKMETFSAGEMRRLFLLKSLLVKSDIVIIDEPFSNSDQKLWEIIYKPIQRKPRAIVLSHFSLEKFFNTNSDIISFDVKKLRDNFEI